MVKNLPVNVGDTGLIPGLGRSHTLLEATIRTGHGTTDWFQIGKGVRQGCVLSLCIFNLYAQYIMQNASHYSA